MKRKKTKPKSIYKKICKKYYIPAAILLLVGVFYFTPPKEMLAQKLVAKGNSYFNSGGRYDLEKATKWYKVAALIDHKLSGAHYQLARVYFVQGKLAEAKSEINNAIAVNVDSNRAYYIKGLIDGYSKNYPEAIVDFSKFVERSPEEWAGYNDLAWAYYKNKDYENAKMTLEKGLEVKPENPWLLNGLGAAYHALGANDKAGEILDKASELAGKLTSDEWKMAYPGNDPASADWDLADFKTDIKVNQGLAYDKSSQEATVVPACSASCQYQCLSGCSMYMYCDGVDPDHGYDYHNTANYYWQDIGYSDTCCPPCSDSSWSPDPSTVCSGESFTQYSNCGTPRGATGTKDCRIDGACGGASGGDKSCALGTPLCASGTAGAVSDTNPWTWTCYGSGTGHTDSPLCSHDKQVEDAQCGGAKDGEYCPGYVIPTDALCEPLGFVSPTPVSFSGSTWSWSCNSTCNGSSLAPGACKATMKLKYKGACGSLNGTNICNSTGPTDSTGCDKGSVINLHKPTGPYDNWTWNCSGSCDVDSPPCSAKGKGSCGWIETNP